LVLELGLELGLELVPGLVLVLVLELVLVLVLVPGSSRLHHHRHKQLIKLHLRLQLP
jgi:hypothetical protein